MNFLSKLWSKAVDGIRLARGICPSCRNLHSICEYCGNRHGLAAWTEHEPGAILDNTIRRRRLKALERRGAR